MESKYSNINYNLYFDNKEVNGTTLTFLELGNLNLPTGKIVACDPLVCLGDTPAFTKTVKPGIYPVTVCIAGDGDFAGRYAAVKLEFSKTKATKWELALLEGQDIKNLSTEDSFYGYPVDAGLGCFCDFETQDNYLKFDRDFYSKNPNGNIYDNFFAGEFKKNADPTNPHSIGDWLNFHLPNAPEQNVMMFHSGFGDGLYPCYWGIDDNGEICSLIVDFMVLYEDSDSN
ncbi:MAG: DUF4241 domain-containing protein [Bacteroidia bacterium]|nr:DUF4241 domain-containing protein [Bacteroidia bacterium]